MERSEEERVSDFTARVIESLDRFDSEESALNGLAFQPGPTDIILSTAVKTGTTVVQQICHGLRSGGDMDFDEISLVSPTLESAHDYGYNDLYAPQPYQPQVFKTHFWYHYTPKGAGKYIVVARKPADTAVSLFYFFENWYFKKGEMTIEDFVSRIWLEIGSPKSPKDKCSTVHHISTVSWYPHRFDKNVLWLHYEDIIQNRRQCVRLIAEFLDIGADDEALQELVTKQSSIEFMKQHSTKFDVHPLKYGRNEAAGLPRDAGLNGNPGKVRLGENNGGKNVIPQYLINKIDEQWNEVVTSVTGCKTYEDLRNGINKELNRDFE